VWFDARDFELDDTRWSVGLGLRYYTPAGALVLDVGWNADKEEGESAVEAHVSIGFPF
jgi:outer membrane protein insertion porin family